MSKPQLNILLTGAGAPGAAGIIHCIKQDEDMRIISVDAHPEAYGRLLTDAFYVVPQGESATFCEEILDIALKENVKVILPLVTKELFAFASHINIFQQHGIKVLVSEYDALQIANDKGKLYENLQTAGISIPEYKIATTSDELLAAIYDLGYPQRIVCFKPCNSNGSRGFRILDAQADEYELLFHQKPNSLYITTEKLKQILTGKKIPPMVVSEYLPGDEFTVDVLMQNGKAIWAVPRLRVKMNNGISTQGEIVYDKAIIDYAVSIAEWLKLDYIIGIQVKRNASGEAKILEINPRVQGTTVACLGAGINFPLGAINSALGIQTAEFKPKWGTKFVRHWNELYY